jgi:hypothetical protein
MTDRDKDLRELCAVDDGNVCRGGQRPAAAGNRDRQDAYHQHNSKLAPLGSTVARPAAESTCDATRCLQMCRRRGAALRRSGPGTDVNRWISRVALGCPNRSSKNESTRPHGSSEASRCAGGMLRAPARVALLGCVGLLAAGCGGSSAPITQQQEVSSYVAYATCLNKHGVEVEVVRTGGLSWEAGPGLPTPGSPSAVAAERDCKALVPRGGLDHIPSAAQTAQNLALMLRYAKCIRAHGVPNFPDPTSQGLRISPSSGIDLNAPAFLAAQKSCQKDSLTLGGGF